MSILKIVSWAVLSILIVSAVLLYIIGSSLARQGAQAISEAVFEGIGNRAIQLDRLGELGVPYLNVVRTKVPKQIYENWQGIHCSLDIDAPPFDPRQENSVVALIKNGPPRRAYLIYQGSPPKFDDFFIETKAISLLGPQKYFEPPPPGLAASVAEKYTHDLSGQYKSAMSGRRYTWESTICANFTFTLFTEQIGD